MNRIAMGCCLMRLSRILSFAVCCLFLVLFVGCRTEHDTGHGGWRDVQDLVDSKLEEQGTDATGSERWEDFKSSVYQESSDVAGYRGDPGRDRRRIEDADRLAKAGLLTLEACLVYSLEFNDKLQAKRAGIRSVGGDALVALSRFLPTVTYRWEHERADRENSELASTNDTHHSVHLSQTLLEFGKDNQVDVELRAAQRGALFDYEDTVRDVLSGVRQKFYTIVLRQQQLAERQKTLAEFQARYEQMRDLEKARRVLEVDVLTARLNMLNEEVNINSLNREMLRQNIDLMHLMGFPVGATNLVIRGKVEDFSLPLKDSVERALARSSAVAAARAKVEEQERRFSEVVWEYVPSLDMRAGWKDDQTVAGLNLDTTDELYALSAFAETHPDTFEGHMQAEVNLLEEGEEGWFVNLSVELPILKGLERKGHYDKEKALLDEVRHELRDEIDAVESKVRKAYQTVLERLKEVEILKETVLISKERLRVQERLKELGKISDNELETFRDRYFRDQDKFFTGQIYLIEAQEKLRYEVRFFEPLP